MRKFFNYLRQENVTLAPIAPYTPDSESADFPFTNLLAVDANNSLRIDILAETDDGEDTLDLLIDRNDSSDWDLLAVINHNVRSTATISAESGTTSATSDLAYPMEWRKNDLYLLLPVPATHRYVRLLIDDTGNPDGHLSFGAMPIGLSTELSTNFKYGWRRLRQKTINVIRTGLNVKHRNPIEEHKVLTFDFDGMSDAQLTTFTTFTDSLAGCVRWFFLIPDSSKYDGYAVSLMTDVEEVMNFYGAVGGVVCEEEGRGIKMVQVL